MSSNHCDQFNPETVTATVTKVVWKPDKRGFGMVWPVLYFDGVELEKWSGISAKFIIDNKIGVGTVISAPMSDSGDADAPFTIIKPSETPALPDPDWLLMGGGRYFITRPEINSWGFEYAPCPCGCGKTKIVDVW